MLDGLVSSHPVKLLIKLDVCGSCKIPININQSFLPRLSRVAAPRRNRVSVDFRRRRPPRRRPALAPTVQTGKAGNSH